MPIRYRLTVPARINILGNPTDANEGDFATISAAVELRAGAWIEPAQGLLIENLGENPTGAPIHRYWLEQLTEPPLALNGEANLVLAAINRLHQYSDEFRHKFTSTPPGIRIATWSQVPRQSGLGGSSLFVLLTLAGLREYYHLDRKIHNDYILSELAQRTEALELCITCGYADRYVPIFGGLAYLDYRGKLHQAGIGQEPLVTYERLDAWVEELPLVAVSTGIQHESGDVHGRMRPRYVAEYDQWQQQGGPIPPLVRLMEAVYQTAWRGKIAILSGDLVAFGKLMNQNHTLVNEMMRYCGFTDGAGWANNLLIKIALENGALGAKLTGAGGGGSVFALVKPGDEERLCQSWQQAVEAADLVNAQIFRPRLALTGLWVERI